MINQEEMQGMIGTASNRTFQIKSNSIADRIWAKQQLYTASLVKKHLFNRKHYLGLLSFVHRYPKNWNASGEQNNLPSILLQLQLEMNSTVHKDSHQYLCTQFAYSQLNRLSESLKINVQMRNESVFRTKPFWHQDVANGIAHTVHVRQELLGFPPTDDFAPLHVNQTVVQLPSDHHLDSFSTVRTRLFEYWTHSQHGSFASGPYSVQNTPFTKASQKNILEYLTYWTSLYGINLRTIQEVVRLGTGYPSKLHDPSIGHSIEQHAQELISESVQTESRDFVQKHIQNALFSQSSRDLVVRLIEATRKYLFSNLSSNLSSNLFNLTNHLTTHLPNSFTNHTINLSDHLSEQGESYQPFSSSILVAMDREPSRLMRFVQPILLRWLSISSGRSESKAIMPFFGSNHHSVRTNLWIDGHALNRQYRNRFSFLIREGYRAVERKLLFEQSTLQGREAGQWNKFSALRIGRSYTPEQELGYKPLIFVQGSEDQQIVASIVQQSARKQEPKSAKHIGKREEGQPPGQVLRYGQIRHVTGYSNFVQSLFQGLAIASEQKSRVEYQSIAPKQKSRVGYQSIATRAEVALIWQALRQKELEIRERKISDRRDQQKNVLDKYSSIQQQVSFPILSQTQAYVLQDIESFKETLSLAKVRRDAHLSMLLLLTNRYEESLSFFNDTWISPNGSNTINKKSGNGNLLGFNMKEELVDKEQIKSSYSRLFTQSEKPILGPHVMLNHLVDFIKFRYIVRSTAKIITKQGTGFSDASPTALLALQEQFMPYKSQDDWIGERDLLVSHGLQFNSSNHRAVKQFFNNMPSISRKQSVQQEKNIFQRSIFYTDGRLFNSETLGVYQEWRGQGSPGGMEQSYVLQQTSRLRERIMERGLSYQIVSDPLKHLGSNISPMHALYNQEQGMKMPFGLGNSDTETVKLSLTPRDIWVLRRITNAGEGIAPSSSLAMGSKITGKQSAFLKADIGTNSRLTTRDVMAQKVRSNVGASITPIQGLMSRETIVRKISLSLIEDMMTKSERTTRDIWASSLVSSIGEGIALSPSLTTGVKITGNQRDLLSGDIDTKSGIQNKDVMTRVRSLKPGEELVARRRVEREGRVTGRTFNDAELGLRNSISVREAMVLKTNTITQEEMTVRAGMMSGAELSSRYSLTVRANSKARTSSSVAESKPILANGFGKVNRGTAELLYHELGATVLEHSNVQNAGLIEELEAKIDELQSKVQQGFSGTKVEIKQSQISSPVQHGTSIQELSASDFNLEPFIDQIYRELERKIEFEQQRRGLN